MAQVITSAWDAYSELPQGCSHDTSLSLLEISLHRLLMPAEISAIIKNQERACERPVRVKHLISLVWLEEM